MKPRPLLLADPSACLRWLVLRDLYRRPPSDPELKELNRLRTSDPLATALLEAQEADGSWSASTYYATSSKAGAEGRILPTAFTLSRLAYLGFDRSLPAVARAAEYLFARQRSDGSWPLGKSGDEDDAAARERYTTVSLQTSLPLRGLAACGYASDPRAERAYEWLLKQRLPDGAWPTGISSGVFGYVAGYRRLPHSLWGCRSNTTGALICLSLHPERRKGGEARKAIDHLLGRETRDAWALGFEAARLCGAEAPRGFFTHFARFDPALILELCARTEISGDDDRVAGLLAFVRSLRGAHGLWEYRDRPQVSRWLTLDLLRSLERVEGGGSWVGEEPRTPFSAYPKRKRT